jgi:PhoH-like ATPase
MAKPSIVVDASAFLHDPDLIQHFPNYQIVVPSVVLDELDRKKTQSDQLGKHARSVMHFIDNLSKKGGDIRVGIPLDHGGVLRVSLHGDQKWCKSSASNSNYGPDRSRSQLFATAVNLQGEGGKVHLLSKDPVTKILAETMGIETHHYKGNRELFETLHKGINYLEMPKSAIDAFYLQGEMPLPVDLHPNEYCVIKGEGNSSCVGKVDGRKKCLVPLLKSISDVWGVRPRNIEQRCALDLLFRDDIKLVTLIGQAGTGKTLLALATALRKVFDDGIYHRVVIARSIMPLGKDLGFLPGSKEEKLQAWLAPFFDNLDYICATSNDVKNSNETKKWIVESEKFQVEAITYMRGRSFSNTFLIIDEAQNLTPHEIKTIISRVGENTKIVVLGDPTQIDNPYLDMDSNGLVYLVGKMKKHDLFGSILFRQTERSALAALAANVL